MSGKNVFSFHSLHSDLSPHQRPLNFDCASFTSVYLQLGILAATDNGLNGCILLLSFSVQKARNIYSLPDWLYFNITLFVRHFFYVSLLPATLMCKRRAYTFYYHEKISCLWRSDFRGDSLTCRNMFFIDFILFFFRMCGFYFGIERGSGG